MKDKHPIIYLMAAAAAVGIMLALWIGTGASWRSAGFWQACSVVLFILIILLSISLFRQVSRLYPLIRFRRSAIR